MMDIEKLVGLTGDDLKQVCDAYHEIKSNEEIQTLRAKVASADVLVEALRGLVDDLKLRATFGQEDAQGVVACGSTVWRRATEALATYDKISEE